MNIDGPAYQKLKENEVEEEIEIESLKSEDIEKECVDYQRFKEKYKTDEDIKKSCVQKLGDDFTYLRYTGYPGSTDTEDLSTETETSTYWIECKKLENKWKADAKKRGLVLDKKLMDEYWEKHQMQKE